MPNKSKRRLPAEWEAQDGVLLAWPHAATDWAKLLTEAEQTFAEIIRAISRFEQVLLIVPQQAMVEHHLATVGIDLQRISFFELAYNDTWSRDFGPLTVQTAEGPLLLDFTFNGWGNKFSAELDNLLTGHLSAVGAFGKTPLQPSNLVLEGGSIDSDGAGTLLTTSACLLEKNRNPLLSRLQLETELTLLFGAERILWLEHGQLKGDDTNGHIDTLARFAPAESIIFQGCCDQDDANYPGLNAMKNQLAKFVTKTKKPYRLLELPSPQACFDKDMNRLPATYANFLVINDAVLVPTYDDPADQSALKIIGQAFPHRELVPIDCQTLIRQQGSLHCVTMQLPKGTLL